MNECSTRKSIFFEERTPEYANCTQYDNSEYITCIFRFNLFRCPTTLNDTECKKAEEWRECRMKEAAITDGKN